MRLTTRTNICYNNQYLFVTFDQRLFTYFSNTGLHEWYQGRIPMHAYNQLNPNDCEFILVAQAEELPNGERIFVEIDDLSVVVFNIAGQYFAIGNVCSHDDGPLGEGDLEQYSVACPRHGARFDIRTGKVLSLPAFVDIPSYPVRVVDGQIEVGIPVED